MKRTRIVCLFVVSCLLTSSVWSKVLLKTRTWQDSAAQKDSPTAPGVAVTDEASQHVATTSQKEVVNCSDERFDKYLPIQTLYSVLNPNKIKVEYKEISLDSSSYPVQQGYIAKDKKYRYVDIKFPRFISDCLKFTDDRNKNLLHAEKVGNNLVLKMENNYDFENDKVYKDYVANNLADNPPTTTHDKYAYCLVAHGVYDKDFNPVPGKGIVSEFPKQRVFLQGIDDEQDVQIMFASPQRESELYGQSPLVGERQEDAGLDCFDVDQMKPGGLLAFESPYKYYADCGECQTAKGIYDALNELENSVGNAETLSEEIRAVLMQDLIKRLEDSGEIDVKIARLKELGKEIMKASDHEMIKPLVEEYEQIAEMLDKYYLQPRVDQLRKDWTAYTHATGERRRGLAEKMKELNKEVGQFAKASFMSDAMINKIASLGLPDHANRVFEFKLNSSYYSHVNHGAAVAGFPKNPVKIQEAIDNEMEIFRGYSEEMNQEYDIKMGYGTHSSSYEKQAEADQKSGAAILTAYKEKEAEYKSEVMKSCYGYGGFPNQVRCRHYWNKLNSEQFAKYRNDSYASYKNLSAQARINMLKAERFATLENEYASTLSTDSSSYWDSNSSSVFNYSKYSYDYNTGSNYDPILYSFNRNAVTQSQNPLYYQQAGFAGAPGMIQGSSTLMMGDPLYSQNPFGTSRGYTMPR